LVSLGHFGLYFCKLLVLKTKDLDFGEIDLLGQCQVGMT
jgi:hypothetical protein